MENNNSLRNSPDYDGMVNVVRKRCKQLHVKESTLLSILPADNLRSAIEEKFCFYKICQTLNFDSDSLMDCDLPLKPAKVKKMKKAFRKKCTNRDLKKTCFLLFDDAERVGRRVFRTRMADFQVLCLLHLDKAVSNELLEKSSFSSEDLCKYRVN